MQPQPSWHGSAAYPAPVSPSPCNIKTLAVCAALAGILIGSGYTIAMASSDTVRLRELRSGPEEATADAGLRNKQCTARCRETRLQITCIENDVG